jgi:hypothetical protein
MRNLINAGLARRRLALSLEMLLAGRLEMLLVMLRLALLGQAPLRLNLQSRPRYRGWQLLLERDLGQPGLEPTT